MTVLLSFEELPGDYAICRIPPGSPVPGWADGEGLVNITQAEDEISITCRADRVPDGPETEKGWAALKVSTLAELDEPGVVLAAVRPISEAGLGVFVLSTFYRDYVLVRRDRFSDAQQALEAVGHSVKTFGHEPKGNTGIQGNRT